MFQIASGSDGMAVDTQGNLYATHGGKVHIYDADGNERQQIDVLKASQCLLRWRRHKTLFITARTSLYSVRMSCRGKLKDASK